MRVALGRPCPRIPPVVNGEFGARCSGGAAGLAVTAFGLELLPKLISADRPRLKPIALNAGVLGIASGVTLATGLLFGLAPAWQGRRSDLSEVLKLGAATSTGDRRCGWFSRTLIVGQVALALVLLADAGLMVQRDRPVAGESGYDPITSILMRKLNVGPDNTAARFARRNASRLFQA